MRALTVAWLIIWRSSASRPVSLSRIFSASLVLGISNVLFGCVPFWALLKASLTLDCSLDVGLRHARLLRDRMRKDRRVPAVHEVQYAIIHAAFPRSQLTNAVAERIGMWSSQVM